MYQEAIDLYSVCINAGDFAIEHSVNISALHETSANALLLKGDFEAAVNNFILAHTPFVKVIQQFPDLVPLPLHLSAGITGKVCGFEVDPLN